MPMYNNKEEEPKEELVIPIYTKDINSLETDRKDCHYKTEERTFKFSELLAIASKSAYVLKGTNKVHNFSRGGALVFVRDREEPYISRDDYSVKKIIELLETNPLACYSNLNQVGSPNIYAYYYEFRVKDNILILPNGAQLFLTSEARKKVQYLHELRTDGPKETCFYEKRKEIRERNRKH